MVQQKALHQEMDEVRDLACGKDVSITFRSQALDRMEEDGFDFQDILYVLRVCSVLEKHQAPGDGVYRVEGSTLDGVPLAVVLVPKYCDRQIKILKTWKRI